MARILPSNVSYVWQRCNEHIKRQSTFSHVTSSRSRKGLFKPVEGEFNFPIPSLPTLKKLDIGYPTQIDVGIIQHSIDLAEE